MNIDEFNRAYEALTKTEQKILYRLMQNKSDDDLSSSMRITKGAVRKHISNICLKFNLNSNSPKRVQLTRLVSLHKHELLKSKKVGKPITRDSNGFTKQQIKVLNLFMGGKEDKEIATSLDITEACVRKHIERVYKQLSERHKEFSISNISKRLALTKLLSKERSMLEPESNNESLTNELVKTRPFIL